MLAGKVHWPNVKHVILQDIKTFLKSICFYVVLDLVVLYLEALDLQIELEQLLQVIRNSAVSLQVSET